MTESQSMRDYGVAQSWLDPGQTGQNWSHFSQAQFFYCSSSERAP